MTANLDQIQGRSLAQTLAIQSQINLPGTVGRILKQVRDLERIAPLFAQAGLVRSLERPNPLNIRVGGFVFLFLSAFGSLLG